MAFELCSKSKNLLSSNVYTRPPTAFTRAFRGEENLARADFNPFPRLFFLLQSFIKLFVESLQPHLVCPAYLYSRESRNPPLVSGSVWVEQPEPDCRPRSVSLHNQMKAPKKAFASLCNSSARRPSSVHWNGKRN
jgi:hypothetical protein